MKHMKHFIRNFTTAILIAALAAVLAIPPAQAQNDTRNTWDQANKTNVLLYSSAKVTGSTTPASATAVLTSNNTNVSNNDTVTIGSKTYTFKTSLTPAEGEVLIGGSADASLLNLIRAVNLTGTPNTDYKCAAAHTQVTASASVTAHTITLTARTAGLTGDALASTDTATTLSFPYTTFTGGGNVLVDTSKGTNFRHILTGVNRKVSFDGTFSGRTVTLTLKQDGTGSRTVVWDAKVRWPGGTVPTLTTTASRSDVFEFIDTGTYLLGRTLALNYTES